MSSYQSFGGRRGASRTAEKLRALRLPPLAGRTFLDVGCNEGFFCAYARTSGAARVVGLDRDSGTVAAARARVPGVEFLCADWDSGAALDGAERFDVVLCASALHYMADQQAALCRLMGAVAPGGVLVLEAGVAAGDAAGWISVRRAIDERSFPTRPALERALAPHAYKFVGRSADQAGDPVPRWVVHVQHRRPMLLALLDEGYSGKTTLVRHIAGGEARSVSLDQVFAEVAATVLPGSHDPLGGLLSRYDVATEGHHVVEAVFAGGLWPALLDRAGLTADGICDPPPLTVLDGYVPAHRRAEALEALAARGYVLWQAAAHAMSPPPALDDVDARLVTLGGSAWLRAEGRFRLHVDVARRASGEVRLLGWAVDGLRQDGPAHVFLREPGAGPDGWRELVPRSRSERPDLVSLGLAAAGSKPGIDLPLPLEGTSDGWREAAGAAELRLGAADGCIGDAVRLGTVVASYEEES